MEKLKHFAKKEAVLLVAAVLAIVSAFFVPPDGQYLSYLNLSVLAILFCLMAAVAGLGQAGVFDYLALAITRRAPGMKKLSLLLILACFFVSALITNDVALITFVPFTIQILGRGRYLIPVIVLETVAANLGSLLTPIGNPQNLFLYTYYEMGIGEFFSVTLPLGGICLVLVLLCSFLLPRQEEALPEMAQTLPKMETFPLIRYCGMFLLSILSVLNILPWWICLLLVAAVMVAFDRKLFARIDYSLLITFVCFFVFVGNLSRIPAVGNFVSSCLVGREILVGALSSQVISNVPAATMLATFTQNSRELLIGVNVGGLGTLIASMASLISFRLYGASAQPQRGKYMAWFSAVNFSLLAILLLLSWVLW